MTSIFFSRYPLHFSPVFSVMTENKPGWVKAAPRPSAENQARQISFTSGTRRGVRGQPLKEDTASFAVSPTASRRRPTLFGMNLRLNRRGKLVLPKFPDVQGFPGWEANLVCGCSECVTPRGWGKSDVSLGPGPPRGNSAWWTSPQFLQVLRIGPPLLTPKLPLVTKTAQYTERYIL